MQVLMLFMHPAFLLRSKVESKNLRRHSLAQSKVSAHGKEAFGTLTGLSTGEGEGWVTWH